MTIREYLIEKLAPFGQMTEGQLTDMSMIVTLDATYSEDNAHDVGVALCGFVGDLLLAPRLQNVSEAGISWSWDYNNLSKWYYYLCKKYGVSPDETLMSASDIPTIVNKTNIW